MYQETWIQLLQVNLVIFIELDSFFQIVVRMFMNISVIDFQHDHLLLVFFIVISNKIVYCSIPNLKESYSRATADISQLLSQDNRISQEE